MKKTKKIFWGVLVFSLLLNVGLLSQADNDNQQAAQEREGSTYEQTPKEGENEEAKTQMAEDGTEDALESEEEAGLDELRQQYDALQASYDKLAKENAANEEKLEKLENKVSSSEKEIAKYKKKANKKDKTISGLRNKVSSLKEDKKQLQAKVKSQTVRPSLGSTGSTTVYITDTGSKYHRAGCRYLSQSSHSISLSNAKQMGYTACSVCY